MPMTKAPDRNETRPSPPSRLRRAAWTACLLAALLAALPAALPRLSQWLLVPATARGLGLAELTADVRRLDFTGLDLGEITLGPEAGIRVAAVQADWTPTGLMRGRAGRPRSRKRSLRATGSGTGTAPGKENDLPRLSAPSILRRHAGFAPHGAGPA